MLFYHLSNDLRGYFMKKIIVAMFFLGMTTQANADCFIKAGKAFSIPPLLLKAIAQKESGMNPNVIHPINTNLTRDYCLMGINSSHMAKLRSLGITPERLVHEPCVCIDTGAWILHGFFKKYGKSWNSVGMYNTGPSQKLIKTRQHYAEQVRKIYYQLKEEKEENETLIAKN